MTNDEILGRKSVPFGKELSLAEEREQLLAEQGEAERAEFEALQAAGADYSGNEVWYGILRRMGR